MPIYDPQAAHKYPVKNLFQCPNICLMTSGGGFRAMIAFCGVYKAMEDVGLIDCITYTSALSGSSW